MMCSHPAVEGQERLCMLPLCPILFYFLRLSQEKRVWDFLDFGKLGDLGTQIKKSYLNSLSLGDSFLCCQMYLGTAIGNILCSVKRQEIPCGGLRGKFHLENIFERHVSPVKRTHLTALKKKIKYIYIYLKLSFFLFYQTIALRNYCQLACQEIGARHY